MPPTTVVSIDVETTGLDHDNDSLLEVGMVIHEMGSRIEENPAFRAVIVPPDRRYTVTAFPGQAARRIWEEIEGPLDMNRIKEEGWYLHGDTVYADVEGDLGGRQELVSIATHYTQLPFLGMLMHEFLKAHGICPEGDKEYIKIIPAGKNFGSFDKPWLEELCRGWVHFSHRQADPGILYWRPYEDEDLPDLQECLDRAGIKDTVPHDSIGDAVLVLKLLEAFYK